MGGGGYSPTPAPLPVYDTALNAYFRFGPSNLLVVVAQADNTQNQAKALSVSAVFRQTLSAWFIRMDEWVIWYYAPTSYHMVNNLHT